MPPRRSRRTHSNYMPDNVSDSDGLALPVQATLGQKRRTANVYDAVAGRVTSTASLAQGVGSSQLVNKATVPPSISTEERHYSERDPRLRPDEVLFRQKRAPPRFAEKDIYFANDDLPDGGQGVLPDSDLLKSLHAYTSRFYEARALRAQGRQDAFVGNRLLDEGSMDETALLAMGILLEEAGKEALGKKGDLVFTEGIVEDDANIEEEKTVSGFWDRQVPKRRKVHQQNSA